MTRRLLRKIGKIPAIAVMAMLVSRVSLSQRPGIPPGLDEYVARAMRVFDVPGIALAVVRDGRVVIARGYGIRGEHDRRPVDAHTRFAIGSNTKAFTAAALGLLVEEGKLQWDTPVRHYMPTFAMWDPYVTRELTVLDLLVHRSGLGLGEGDLMIFPASSIPRSEILRRVRFLKPATSFRSQYAYSNLMYLVAGELVQAVSGKSWEDFVRDRILTPLGMSETATHLSAINAADNFALPHSRVDSSTRQIDWYKPDNVDPAGGISTNAADMAKWLIVQLDSGRLADGRRLFSASMAKKFWDPVVAVPLSDPPPGFPSHAVPNLQGYGLGWTVRDRAGQTIVGHNGGLNGFVSQVVLVPQLRLGIVAMTNAEAVEAFRSINQWLLDYYQGRPQSDYITILDKTRTTAKTSTEIGQHDSTLSSTLPLSRYAGTYVDAWRGDVTISEEGGRPVMRFSQTEDLVGDMSHWQRDTFLVRWRKRSLHADALVTFAIDKHQRIDHVTMAPASPDTDFSYDFQDLLLRPTAKTSVSVASRKRKR